MIEKQQIVISHYQQGISQREIAKSMRLNRKTVRRYLAQYKEERARSALRGVGVITPPKYDSSKRSKIKLIGEVTDYIDQHLEQNDIKRSEGLAKQCMAATDIHEALVGLGFDISYRSVCKYIQQKKQQSKEVYIRQTYQPGNSSEFDWGWVKLRIGGKIKNLMLAVFTLCYSNHRWARLFYRQDTPSFLDAHVRYFDHLKGVPSTTVYDNMKVAVAKFTIKQSDKKPTEDLLKISSYYQFGFRFCNAARGNEKGHVERSVEYVRRKAFAPIFEFNSLDQANEHLEKVLYKINAKSVKGKDCSIIEQLDEERPHLRSLPTMPYDTAMLNQYRIDKYHTISVDTNHYSVPESIHGPTVGVKIYPAHICIYNHQHQLVATHERQHTKHQWFIDMDHYWNSLRQKPGALPFSQAMNQASHPTKSLFNEYYKDIPRDFIELMIYCREHQISIQQLHEALLQYKRKCLNSTPNSEIIIFMLQGMQQQGNHHLDQPNDPNSMSANIEQHCTEQLQQIQNLI